MTEPHLDKVEAEQQPAQEKAALINSVHERPNDNAIVKLLASDQPMTHEQRVESLQVLGERMNQYFAKVNENLPPGSQTSQSPCNFLQAAENAGLQYQRIADAPKDGLFEDAFPRKDIAQTLELLDDKGLANPEAIKANLQELGHKMEEHFANLIKSLPSDHQKAAMQGGSCPYGGAKAGAMAALGHDKGDKHES